METVETPNEALENHDITHQLVKLGFTTEELQSIRFRGTNAGWALDRWPLTWWPGIPDVKSLPALGLMKAYCALKWIVLEDPACSREREDAWTFITETVSSPLFRIGINSRKAQSKRARNPRGIINSAGKTLDQVIGELALLYPVFPAKDLWTHFWASLEGRGLEPKEVPNLDQAQIPSYSYTFQGREKKISFPRFQNVVSQARQKKKSR